MEACRWVAVRHAPDHIHIAATLVREDGRRPTRDFDRKKAQAEARRIETDFGLRRLNPGDGSAAKRPTSKEHFKAHRTGQAHTSRDLLRTRVRQAAAATRSEGEFFKALEGMGVHAQIRYAPSGDALGYKVALPGDTNKAGEPVYFSGSTLAPDLSLPRIRERQTATEGAPTARSARRPDPWHQATAGIERIPNALTADGDPAAAQAHLAALGETLDLLPATTQRRELRSQLQQAARGFERATRSRIHADHHHARALRSATKQLLHTPAEDGALLAMVLDAAVLAMVAASRWHTARQHAQQEAAARQALHHVQAAYQQAAAQPLANLRKRTPSEQIARRYAHHIRQAVPDHAERILADDAWSALTATLATAENTGHNPADLLQHAAQQRALDDARFPAEVLTWRLHRLGQRPAPSPRAQAARIRSTHLVTQATKNRQSAAGPASPQLPAHLSDRSRRRAR